MIFHILTAVLVLLKALEMIDWSWWLVLAPSLFMFIFGTVVLFISLFTLAIINK